MRFRRRGGFRRRGIKEPVSWFRAETRSHNTNAFGVADKQVLFDPESVVFGNVDTRITVRRIKLEMFPYFNFTANAAAQFLITGIGVYMTDASAPIRDPLLTTEEDQETDWLYLAHVADTVQSGASILCSNANTGDIRGFAFDALAPDIKAMRKLDNQQLIVMSWNCKQLDITDFTAPTQSFSGVTTDVSVLYSRTMRR